MKVLAIDCGNTRIKWGLWESGADRGNEGAWMRVGALVHDEARDADTGVAAVFAALPAPERIAIANVAGEGARALLEGALARLSPRLAIGSAMQPIWARSEPAQCGVVNRYHQPDTLGVDRWAALIGAWHRLRSASLVVCAGTATTADLLSASGEFRGGVILPGLELMKRSLAENTARLPLADGVYLAEPRSTADAIESGALHAQAGAIERMHARLQAGGNTGRTATAASTAASAVPCLMSGGAAARIAACLSIPHQVLDHLVLDGLVRIALDGAPWGGAPERAA